MEKIIDLDMTVADLVSKYPEIKDVLIEIGFKELQNKLMLNSVGKFMTLKRGSVVKNISMDHIKEKLIEHGYTIKESEISNDDKARLDKLKTFIERLSQGEDIDSVRADFAKEFSDVDSKEIMKAEEEIIASGVPIKEVQKLCDVHSALFHGATETEQGKKLKAIDEVGHPIYNLHKENDVIADLIDKTLSLLEKKDYKSVDIENLRKIRVHYTKKGDLIYPLLKVKYNIPGPSDVMWSVDDKIRDAFKKLDTNNRDEAWAEALKKNLQRAKEMIYKEENILFPTIEDKFNDEEWHNIYEDFKAYSGGLRADDEWNRETLDTDEVKSSYQSSMIELKGGHFRLDELEALLNTMPYEITFVDANDINAFFNDNGREKLFKRPMTAIGRDVYSCHPPKIEAMVREIISMFKSGAKDQLGIWMNKEGHDCYVLYMAVRDEAGKYLGTMELVQEMDFAKEHFKDNK